MNIGMLWFDNDNNLISQQDPEAGIITILKYGKLLTLLIHRHHGNCMIATNRGRTTRSVLQIFCWGKYEWKSV